MLSSKTRVLEREEAKGLPAVEEIGKESLVIRLGIFFSVTPSLLCLTLVVENVCSVFFFNDTATTEIYTLSLHDALPISLNHFS